jgi:RimJ/RimL family protein N-acetyltransferase
VRFTCRPLVETDAAALADLLDRGGPADAYLHDALENGGVAGFCGAWDGARLEGAAFLRRGAISAAATTPRLAAFALATALSARGPWTSVVGPETPCGAIVDSFRTTEPFRVDRVQTYMVVARGEPLGPGGAGLRPATPADLDAVVPLVAAYRVEDGLSNPGDDHAVWIRSHATERIRAGHLFVAEEAGRLVFTGAFNFAGRWGAGLGGIYTVPDRRGRGIAGRATADLCRRALELGPCATLHVDPRNAAAIHAYERAGLRRAGEFRLTFR